MICSRDRPSVVPPFGLVPFLFRGVSFSSRSICSRNRREKIRRADESWSNGRARDRFARKRSSRGDRFSEPRSRCRPLAPARLGSIRPVERATSLSRIFRSVHSALLFFRTRSSVTRLVSSAHFSLSTLSRTFYRVVNDTARSPSTLCLGDALAPIRARNTASELA